MSKFQTDSKDVKRMAANTLKILKEVVPDAVQERTGMKITTDCEKCGTEREMEHVVLMRTTHDGKQQTIQCYECLTCEWRHDKALTDILRAEFD